MNITKFKFWRFFQKRASGNIAKDRLKVVLVSDRVNCSPTTVENIRLDILAVLAKYVEIDTDHIDIQIIQSPSNDKDKVIPTLIARVPFKEMNAIHLQEKYDQAI